MRRWFRRPGTIAYAPYEWLCMRLAFGYFCLYKNSPFQFVPGHWPQTFSGQASFAEAFGQQPAPLGLAQFFDLTFAAREPFTSTGIYLFYAALALYAAGRLPLLATAVLFGFDLIYGTLGNSQGATHHTGNIVGYVLLGQLVFFASRWVRHGWSPRRLRETRHEVAPGAVYFSLQLACAAYVLAALSKLVRSGFGWFGEVANFSVQLTRNHWMDYYHDLSEKPAGLNTFMIDLVSHHPLVAQGFFAIGLVAELFAFLALFGRAWALAFGAVLLGLHVGISEMMHLGFFFNKAVLVIFFINPFFWAAALAGRGARRGLARAGAP